jgi:hypothetical protein
MSEMDALPAELGGVSQLVSHETSTTKRPHEEDGVDEDDPKRIREE